MSTASRMVGVAASEARPSAVLTAGIAGVAAGAMALAAGEYVSVSAQSTSSAPTFEREALQHAADPNGELVELADIYERRCLPRLLAAEVARALHSTDPLAAHARDELGQRRTAALGRFRLLLPPQAASWPVG